MKKIFLTCVCVMSLAFGLSGIAGANGITNGGFETGDFTGWTTNVPGTGLANVLTSTASFNAIDNSLPNDYGPTEGTFFAELIARAELTQAQTGLSWNAGDTITFDWAFLAFDELPFGNDKGVFKIIDTDNADTTTFTLASVQSVGNYQDTGWQSFSHTFASTGGGKIVFKSLNVPNDDIYEFASSLLVDNVNMEPVPEPATVALLGIGILGLAGAETRRRRKTKTKMIS